MIVSIQTGNTPRTEIAGVTQYLARKCTKFAPPPSIVINLIPDCDGCMHTNFEVRIIKHLSYEYIVNMIPSIGRAWEVLCYT